MDTIMLKKHYHWRDRLLAEWPGRFLIGFLLVVLFSGLMVWGIDGYINLDNSRFNSLIGVSFCFSISFLSLHKVMGFPEARKSHYILPTVLAWYGLFVFLLFSFRLDYSVYYIVCSLVFSLFFFYLAYFAVVRHVSYNIAFLPVGRAEVLQGLQGVNWIKLEKPAPFTVPVDAVMTDLYADIPEHWQRFLAACTLEKIPVFHYKRLLESLTGRVKIEHISENEFGSLQPPVVYSVVKRVIDITAVLLTAPLTLPVMLFTALAVRMDSPGPVLFAQQRVGQGGRDFIIYKFRSMGLNSEADGARLAQCDDSRVTRVGRFIRKSRLDELPQFFNVLKGDMSLIGPRPEQRAFVEKFDEEIPFYIYRHVVKPGITGWAQVLHGYASNADDTRIKIQHDFYYIKNFSFWLDVLIVYKTIRIIFTGFGAK